MAAVAESSGGLGVALLWLGGYQRHPSLNPALRGSQSAGGGLGEGKIDVTNSVPGLLSRGTWCPPGDSCQPGGGWGSEGFLGQQDLGEGLSSLLERSG